MSHTRCTMVDSDVHYFQSGPAESPERFGDNRKTFKPKILVGGTFGSHLSRNATI
jgi:hypothetical protein